MDNRPIGVFDSGVGGLTILLELQKVLPKESFIFVGDRAHVPYGGKNRKQILEYTNKIMEFLVKKNVKMVVVACNTATVYAIESLRSKYRIPIVGTVPVIKTIANITKTKKTAVFSTPATAKSPYLKKLIKTFAKGVQVYRVGGTGLEELIEIGNLKDKKIDKILHKSLDPLVEKGVDAIALSCTHYPFLRKQIKKIVGNNVRVVDSGGAVARRTKAILEINNTLGKNKKEDYYYTTADKESFRKVLRSLLKFTPRNIDSITL